MSLSRRSFMTALGAASMAMSAPLGARIPAPLPWRNWSGGLVASPRARVAPATESELARFLARTQGPVRPVGSGHSFSPLVPTDGDLLVLDRLEGVLDVDAQAMRARVGAGTRLSELGPLLERRDQACPNMPDIDRQTLAGALATATHGTGDFRSMAGYVSALRIVTPRGEIRDIDGAAEPDLLQAAAVSLGALGVVTAATLDNRAPLRLKAHNYPMRLDAVLDQFDDLVRKHRHFEFFPIPHCDHAFALAIDPSDEPIHNPPPTPEEDQALFDALQLLLRTPIVARRTVANGIVESLEASTAVDVSYRILCNIRNQRFNEMEYSVPADVGMACVREIMETISDGIDVAFPLEVRYVGGEEAWLSMFEGGPRVSISVHEFADRDHRPYFEAMEQIFLRYDGRPHWGKVHSLDHAQLTALYPRLEDFRRVRADFDPDGRMLNPHLRRVLGVSGT